jgi:predicted Rossmann-fold nucleotide-binding protein
VILVGTDFWCGLVDWLRDRLLAAGTISPSDLDLLQVTDSPAEAVAACVAGAERQWAES